MNYKISIILPIYNVEKYIREALESIIRQTIGTEKLEVIMVNDCSTDKSGIIMDEYAKKYNNFIAIHLNERSGAAGRPRNIGMKRATGEYIMFLDPDDYYEDYACETLYDKAIETKCDIVMAEYNMLYSSGKKELPNHFSSLFNEEKLIINCIDENVKFLSAPPAICTKIFKREFVFKSNIIFPDKIVAQDMVFSIHAFMEARGIAFINIPMHIYRIRDLEDKSISFNCDINYFRGINKAQKLVYEIFCKYKKENLYKYVLELNLSYYLDQLIITECLNYDERNEVIREMSWLFIKSREYDITIEQNWLNLFLEKLLSENYEEALELANAFENLRKYNINLERSKQWLDNQLQEHKSEIVNKDKIIEELRDWNEELEKGKQWLNEQLQEHKNEIISKDKIIEELRSWNGELEKGKQWLNEQLQEHKNEIINKDKIIEELRSWNGELEKGKQWLEKQFEMCQNEIQDRNNIIEEYINIINELKTFKGWVKFKKSKK